MLFTGDMEEGWEKVEKTIKDKGEVIYYCISHHGSITGHIGKYFCSSGENTNMLEKKVSSMKISILMGRDNSYRGIFNEKVVATFPMMLKTEENEPYVQIDWSAHCTATIKEKKK